MHNKLSLIDTHCDTAFELFHRNEGLYGNSCHVDLYAAQCYKNYAQFFAVWADKRRSDDECFEDFIKISDNLRAEIAACGDKIVLARTFSEMNAAFSCGKRVAFLAVEDARILAGKIERLDELSRHGVKYLTLLWGGDTCIGASHDRCGGLTEFGRAVVIRCFELGIVPDVSHASERVADEVCELALQYGKSFIASHSNCYEQFAHARNLRARHLDTLIRLGGTVGLNLCPYHVKNVTSGDQCTLDDVLLHVEKYMELGAVDALGMGCDLDGTDLPRGLSGVGDMYKIADGLARIGYPDALIEKIFYQNQYEFIKRNFI